MEPEPSFNDDGPDTDRCAGKFDESGERELALSDERIAADVRQILSGFYLDVIDVDVVVHAGIVVLYGTVTDELSRLLAEDLVASCTGVERVESKLRVQRR